MSYLRISTVSADVALTDLGYTVVHPAVNLVVSNQFSVEDLQNSSTLSTAINGGTLTAQVLLDATWTSVTPGTFTGADVYSAYANIYEISNEVNNQKLVDNSDASAGTQLHHHDTKYFTKTQLSSTADAASGASLIGLDVTPAFTNFTPASNTVQAAIEAIDAAFVTDVTLDKAYTNDSDGRLNVNGTNKPLDLRSNNASTNDIILSRTNGTDIQDILRADVSANELILGAATVGALTAITTRVATNLVVDGNLTITGTTTDTTVNELNVTNDNIRLRDGATAVPGSDGSLIIERGTSGADANIRWSHTDTRWRAGLQGSDQLIALLDTDEVVTGVYEFQGGAAAEPSMYVTNKASAPSTNLGTANQYPVSMVNGILAFYDKSNSRNKFLSVSREYMAFVGRDSGANTNEYARIATFTSNQAGNRLIRNATLVGISAQTKGAETWTARVRKNGSVTNLASLALTAVDGGQDGTLNVDFNAGDDIEVYIDGTSIDRPVIKLEFAYRV